MNNRIGKVILSYNSVTWGTFETATFTALKSISDELSNICE